MIDVAAIRAHIADPGDDPNEEPHCSRCIADIEDLIAEVERQAEALVGARARFEASSIEITRLLAIFEQAGISIERTPEGIRWRRMHTGPELAAKIRKFNGGKE